MVKRFLVAVTILHALLLVGAASADAACLGPSIEYRTGPVRRGEAITVTGSGFGDNCYDRSLPPPGEGYLGKPLKEIEVVVLQGDEQTVVARGAASDRYSFEVDVVIPLETFPGEARIVALDAATGLIASGDSDRPLLVTSGLPSAADQSTAVFEGADQRSSTTSSTSTETDGRATEAGSKAPPRQQSSDDDSIGLPPVVVGLGVLVAMGLIVATVLTRERRRL